MRDKETQRHYWVWADMVARCTSPNHAAYHNYGGRGIAVCGRWRQSFDRFLTDMGYRPTRKHTIDRVNNDGDYTPDNCRWATRLEQNRNKRLYRCNRSGVPGVERRRSGSWRARIRIGGVLHCLGETKSFFDAVALRKSAEARMLK